MLTATVKAINLLLNGEAPGADAIPAEVYKAGGLHMALKLIAPFQSKWTQGTIPQEEKDASIVHLYKWKGNTQSFNNHQGISFLSITGKVLTRILLNHLVQHIEQGLLPVSQCGFRKGRGTIDMMLMEKCQEQYSNLCMTFIDLTKAFDRVSQEGLWEIKAKCGCAEKFITMVWQFHDSMLAFIVDFGDSAEPFPVTNGVKQGCMLDTIIFNMMFSAMLTDVFCDCDTEIDISYWTDDRLQLKETTGEDMNGTCPCGWCWQCQEPSSSEQELTQMPLALLAVGAGGKRQPWVSDHLQVLAAASVAPFCRGCTCTRVHLLHVAPG
ncbi:RNA-directed DNA polymerase from mobile element jockey-like [Alligator mississippiensis]|uniref:RNA-directed DNA polymerase from mobile element jockey-like n=1 Tax=Alligator mississippiensis TaxID=8496 RepID=A0A151P1T7_ALLMI|nr:RNA-directed DNA polymerase from mobile element jockey-like [Alligator mississippiensis]